MNSPDPLRGKVAAQLTAMSVPGGPLHTKSNTSTMIRFAASPARLRLRRTVVDRYLARDTPLREGRSAILTAGAPGAGKSTLLHDHIPDLDGYRSLDADEVKDFLIEQALRDGDYAELLGTELADGAPLAPRELAALVHDESTALIDQIRRLCLDRGENVLIEGTLRWPGQGPRVYEELVRANYTSLRVIGVEVPRDIAHEQALSRWWDGRLARRADPASLGGRFTPPAAIDDCYDDDTMSKCARNAQALAAAARNRESMMVVELELFRRATAGGFETFE
ncbi:zeta toxin family protein [Rhodococcus sp. NPDC059968]|uniref:zeta toxin family protein n=1 Tax=Rhodococcus sp. NPDC059968 TaxID=3347017 RepID=UPI00366F9F01